MHYRIGRLLKYVSVCVSLLLSLSVDAQRIRPDQQIQVAPDSMPDYILLSDSTNGFLQFEKVKI